MDKEGRYFACSKHVNYRLSFDKSIENCGVQVEPEVYNDVKEARTVANQILKNSDLSCAILKCTKYKSAITGETKSKELEIVDAIIGKYEKSMAREKFLHTV